jgi:peptidyl-prolyl cis-trans isomerase SDCCAG10
MWYVWHSIFLFLLMHLLPLTAGGQSEPPTSGKVILHTSCGDVDVELWAKEAPRAVRNFLQLAMEQARTHTILLPPLAPPSRVFYLRWGAHTAVAQYYDGTVFHRVIRNFMVQGGDPTGESCGAACVVTRTCV